MTVSSEKLPGAVWRRAAVLERGEWYENRTDTVTRVQ